jgi:hypothetical protein
MKLPSLRNLKRIEIMFRIARHIIFIVLMFAPLPMSTQHGEPVTMVLTQRSDVPQLGQH